MKVLWHPSLAQIGFNLLHIDADGNVNFAGPGPHDLPHGPAAEAIFRLPAVAADGEISIHKVVTSLTPAALAKLEAEIAADVDLAAFYAQLKSNFAVFSEKAVDGAWPDIPQNELVETVFVECNPISHMVFSTYLGPMLRLTDGRLLTHAEFQLRYGKTARAHISMMARDRISRLNRALDLLEKTDPYIATMQVVTKDGVTTLRIWAYDNLQAKVYAKNQNCTILDLEPSDAPT